MDPSAGNVKIKGGSQILQKNTRFSWIGFDLPLDNVRFESVSRLNSKVVEYVPETRISWVTYAGDDSVSAWGDLTYLGH
jgi:hypothetical protein